MEYKYSERKTSVRIIFHLLRSRKSQNIFETLDHNIDFLSGDPDYDLYAHVNAEQLQAVSPTARYRLLEDGGTTGLDDDEYVLSSVQNCKEIIGGNEKQDDEQIVEESQVVSASGQSRLVRDYESNRYDDGEHLPVLSFDYFGQEIISREEN